MPSSIEPLIYLSEYLFKNCEPAHSSSEVARYNENRSVTYFVQCFVLPYYHLEQTFNPEFFGVFFAPAKVGRTSGQLVSNCKLNCLGGLKLVLDRAVKYTAVLIQYTRGGIENLRCLLIKYIADAK